MRQFGQNATESLSVISALKITLKTDLGLMVSSIVCEKVKKCIECSRIIKGKFMKQHKCGYYECGNCGVYVDSEHKCYMKKLKAKGGNCTADNNVTCRQAKLNDDSIKRKDWCCSGKTHSTLYIFFDFEATQNTGKHEVNLSVAQDYDGKEYIHENIDDFCKFYINEKFNGYTFIANNGKGYDFVSVLKWLIKHGIKPFLHLQRFVR